MEITDTHAHLFLPEFEPDLDEIVSRARQLNITRFFLPNVDTETIERLIEITDKYPDCFFPLAGIHPCSVNENFMQQIEHTRQWFETGRFYGFGETGIDLYWSTRYQKEQVEVFRAYLKMAKYYQVPAIVHIRNAYDEVMNVIENEQDGTLSGILHCFGGNASQARRAINAGFLLGIGGVVTYKNSTLPEVLTEIDPKYIVTETDAPYLAPVPFRGKRNEPSYLTYILQKLADIYQTTSDEIAGITTQNALKLFKI